MGGFNVNKIHFLRKVPVRITKDTKGEWEYYDDFRTSKFLKEADTWKNLKISYLGNFNVPQTYGYYNLVQTDPGESYIQYHFRLPVGTSSVNLRPFFSLQQGGAFVVSAGSRKNQLVPVSTIPARQGLQYYHPTAVIPVNPQSQDFFLRLEFKNDPSQFEIGKNILKVFWLYNNFTQGATVNVVPIAESEYHYDSQLEVVKSNKWIQKIIKNTGWIQAHDGILFLLADSEANQPLVYQFSFDKPVSKVDAFLKTFTSENAITVSYDTGRGWKPIDTYSDNDTKVHLEKLTFVETQLLSIKFDCKKTGPTCQVRDVKLKIRP